MISGLSVVVLLATTAIATSRAATTTITTTTTINSNYSSSSPRVGPLAGATNDRIVVAEAGVEAGQQQSWPNLIVLAAAQSLDALTTRASSSRSVEEKVETGKVEAHHHQPSARGHQSEQESASSPLLGAQSRLAAAAAPAAATTTTTGSKTPPVYTNQFVIQVKGGESEARKLAHKHGFVYLNHILGDYYHLEHRRLSKRSASATQDALNISIQNEPQVLLLERQVLKRRVKRDFLELPSPPSSPNNLANFNGATAAADHSQGGNHGRNQQQSTPAAGGSHSLSPLPPLPPVRPANQQRQQQPQMMMAPTTQQQQHQLLRPSNGGASQPLSVRPSHHYTRPANQAPPTQSSGSYPAQRLQQQHLQALQSALRLTNSNQQQQEASSRTQELLETAASSGSLLYQQASAAHKQLAGNNGAGSDRRLPQPSTISAAADNSNAGLNATLNQSASSQFANLTGSSSSSSSSSSSLKSDKQMPFNDPSWPLMWYLDGGAKNGFDLNVMAAWKMGYTGKGIVITILDDGLEKDHPDLQANYDPLASFDINGDDADPMPRYDVNDSNRHGTRCAGEVAAVPDNNICSIGIAYNSKVGGVRMLDGDVTDAVEARSLGLNNQHIHIYSASWGPDDNGKTVDGPGEMATKAFIEGVTNGRQGLGSIFVFASGNGGREHDNCNCDGYTNSIWTLSISSATENGYVPWYIEACSSTLATTYSSGSYEERQIATTDLHHSCTSSHTGTSASAPLAAGICALVLESNPKLTWRDMQHIVVRTAKPANLVAKDWRTNALGRNVSHAFGYGLMDAAAMITMAKKWTTVPVQYTCEVRSPQMEKFIPAKGYIELKLRAECANVRFLEHVQSKVTLTSSRRGDLHIYLISPHGTRSTLLAQRPNDQAEQGFRNWPFMTVHSWGESPNGIWTLEVHNDGKPQNRAYLKEWTLILYGTYDDPNKHLDPATLTPPPSTFTPAPHHSLAKVSSGGGGGIVPPPTSSQNSKQPVSAPPPPIPSTNGNHYPNVDIEPPGSQQPQPSSPATNGGRPGLHWSYSSAPPPPLPPQVLSTGSSSSGSASGSRPTTPLPPTTTTQSSYVTTFKTIVSTSSSSQPIAGIANGGAASAGQLPYHHNHNHHNHHHHSTTAGQAVQHQTTMAGAGSVASNGRVHHMNGGQVVKADFEIVSPAQPTEGPSGVTMVGGGQHRPSGTPHHPLATPVNGVGNNGGDLLTFGDNQQTVNNNSLNHQTIDTVSTKPPVDQIDGNKIDMPMMKPPISSQDLQSTSTNNNQNHELNSNQIDSKLTKDYRSSGDQSIYSQSVNSDNNQLSMADLAGTGLKTLTTTTLQQHHQNSSNSNSQLPSNWPLLFATMLILIHLTTTNHLLLVRP